MTIDRLCRNLNLKLLVKPIVKSTHFLKGCFLITAVTERSTKDTKDDDDDKVNNVNNQARSRRETVGGSTTRVTPDPDDRDYKSSRWLHGHIGRSSGDILSLGLNAAKLYVTILLYDFKITRASLIDTLAKTRIICHGS